MQIISLLRLMYKFTPGTCSSYWRQGWCRLQAYTSSADLGIIVFPCELAGVSMQSAGVDGYPDQPLNIDPFSDFCCRNRKNLGLFLESCSYHWSVAATSALDGDCGPLRDTHIVLQRQGRQYKKLRTYRK